MADNRHFILQGHDVVAVDLMTWAHWIETAHEKRIVAKTWVNQVEVSTVFLGLNHRYGDEGPLQLFETMIFGGDHNEYQWRYATWDEAEAGHWSAVKLIGGGN
jgi:hypothetical protein